MNCLRRPLVVVACALLLAAGAAPAQTATPGVPPALEPLPEIPPPPDLGDAELEPQITITQKEGESVQEARVNGRIAWIKVTPRHGRPYFLVPDGGAYTFIRRDSLDAGLKVPLWVLFSF
jgi:hypothetical protein